jgi:hypothetical protein
LLSLGSFFAGSQDGGNSTSKLLTVHQHVKLRELTDQEG